jgi:succinyl-CoA synthetase alpha subunit
MRHSGSIVSGADESAAAKKKVMRGSGIHVVDSPATIGAQVKEVLG